MAKNISVNDAMTRRTAVVNYDKIAGEEERDKDRKARILLYQKYWLYYDNAQYDKENGAKRNALQKRPDERLPEHQRKHAYSGVIEEGVDFITDQLMDNLSIEVKTEAELKSGEADDKIPEEQIKFDEIWDASDMDLEAPDLTREALVSADAYIMIVWDEADQLVKFIPYEATAINPTYSETNYKKMIMATVYSSTYSDEEKREMAYREEYVLGQTSEGFEECIYLKFEEDNETPIESKLLNIPFIPIVHLKAIRKKVRKSFGESIVKKAISDADRYNAVNQLEFLIGRYNSSSHLALFGTESKINPEQLFLGNEVNDFWSFPNTTEAKVMTLPTDPAMINNQCEKIEKNMYKKLGIQKMDLEDMKGLGAPSGYSLEIMNRKTNGVFTRIQKELTKGYTEVFNKALDMQAIMESGKEWWDVDTEKAYPNRTVKFTFGTVFVADSDAIRQDFVAGMISRKRALMQKGLSEQDAMEISEEAEEEKANENAANLEGIAGIIKKKEENSPE